MQTLSPTISPTIHSTISPTVTKPEVTKLETSFLSAIAQSPVLQISLSGMDASLNDELDRYRHWQANGQTISYLNPFRPRAVSTQSIWTSPNMLLSETLSPIASSIEAHSDRRTIQMPVMPPIAQSPNISAAELHKYTGQNLDSLENVGLDEAPPYIDFGMGIDSPTMAKIPEPDDDEILQSFADDYANDYQNSMNQETEFSTFNAPPKQSALRSLMNPVGIISLLLLLGSSAAIGYLLVDPSGVMKFFKPDARPKTAQADSKNEDLGKDINLQNPQKANDSGVPFVPFAGDKTQSTQATSGLNSNKTNNKNNKTLTNPALSSNSFVSSAPLRTVPSAAFPSISIAPLPPALAPLDKSYDPPARKSYEAPPDYSEPAPRKASSRSPNSTRAAATPTLTNNAPATSPATAYVAPITPVDVAPNPANNSNPSVKYAAPLSSAPASSYRVVVENGYAANAQQVERDAYVRPSDGQVQVGSYRDQNSAQNRIEQLRRQGIPARIE